MESCKIEDDKVDVFDPIDVDRDEMLVNRLLT